MILEVYWGSMGYPFSQMWEILLVFGVMSKLIYLDSGLIIYYFDHFIM